METITGRIQFCFEFVYAVPAEIYSKIKFASVVDFNKPCNAVTKSTV